MRRVCKQAEPVLLAAERQDGNSFANLRKPFKQAMQKALCAEQGYLCCFCESRIEPTGESMKIAHFVPQTVDGAQALVWDNLYGACYGNEPLPKKQADSEASAQPGSRLDKGLHCDAKQGQQVLDDRLRPDRIADGLIQYMQDGSVDSPDLQLRYDLIVKLNLNHRRLKTNRVLVLDSLMELSDYDPETARRLIGRVPDADGRLSVFVSYLLAMVG